MRKLLTLTLLFSSLIAAPVAQADLPKGYEVVLQTENFPPFNMAEGGKNFAKEEHIRGISADTVREMFKRAGIAYSMTLRFPWDRIYQSTLDLPNHGLFSTSMTDERRSLFKWVGPIAQYESVLLSAPGSNLKLTSLAQAKGYRIGAYKSSAVSQRVEAQGLEPVNALRDQENLQKLLTGKIDLWATSDPVWRYYAKQEGVSGLNTVLVFNSAPLYLALNKDTPDEVITRLQNALEQMKTEGYGSCVKHPELC
ncbi:amino acid ABC transporter substrate-binding protein [Stutzerimonas stutzeri]|uniref:Amino acid ABC transporter substrate-binding protein n=1 Tax=Stutzerimonas stutzeri TaxID=316 RepID=W8R3Z3_STUST|nr:ABC transporter substrate-binding protein [Stutzerimonas stutzeri]AHL77339.1 amino acid ABC transporter substrate-binding protein [Stutzerimonas stutzeri]MCQ4330234.1 ABC transporter substrate-binding protein [Stutzerimonas stutzeri]